MFTKRQTTVLYVFALLTVIFAVAVIYFELRPEPQRLRVIHQLPAFSLTSQDGATVTLESFKGNVWLADFVYTTCNGPCPLITHHMATLQDKVAGMPDVRLVSISTDPVNDKPPVLKAYAAKFGAGDHWTFLTGPVDQVYNLIQKGFLLPIQAPKGEQIIHSTRMMLVDKSGAIRAFYDGDTAIDDAQILKDIKSLRAE